MTKLCKDCKFYKKYHGYEGSTFDECLCPDLKREINPITGEKQRKFCRLERVWSDRCGEEGRYWTSKDGTEEPEKPKNFWERLFGV